MFRRYIHFLLTFTFIAALVGCATVTEPARYTQRDIRMASVELPTPIIELPEPIVEEVAIPFPIQLRELHQRAVVKFTPAEIHCMAEVIYREARGEPEIGQVGVGYLILNRMGHSSYPKTACGVVYDRKHSCQFSWACGSKSALRTSSSDYQNAQRIALLVMHRSVENPVDDSTFFRHVSLRYLAKNRTLRTVLGNHRFIAGI